MEDSQRLPVCPYDQHSETITEERFTSKGYILL